MREGCVRLPAARGRRIPASSGLLLLCALTACNGGRTVSANLTGYNHTDKTIGAFYVDGVGGGT